VVYVNQNEDDLPKAYPEKYKEFLALNKELAKKWPNITHRKDPPADADEWKDKEDKLNYLEK